MLTTLNIEQQANQLRQQILQIALRYDLDSDVLALAFADILASVALQSDRQYGQQRLEDRLQVFLKRAEQTYEQTRRRLG